MYDLFWFFRREYRCAYCGTKGAISKELIIREEGTKMVHKWFCTTRHLSLWMEEEYHTKVKDGKEVRSKVIVVKK